MKRKNLLVVGLSLLSLASCTRLFGDDGVIHDRSNQYLKSKNSHRLVTPKGVDGSGITDNFYIPTTNVTHGTTPLPPGSQVAHMAAVDIRSRQALPADAVVREQYQGEPSLVIKEDLSDAMMAAMSSAKKRSIKVVDTNVKLRTVTILDTYSTFDRVASDTPVYLVRFFPGQHDTRIVLRSKDNKPINVSTAKRLLGELEAGLYGKKKYTGIMQWIGSHTS